MVPMAVDIKIFKIQVTGKFQLCCVFLIKGIWYGGSYAWKVDECGKR
jgi:hypothetical protein